MLSIYSKATLYLPNVKTEFAERTARKVKKFYCRAGYSSEKDDDGNEVGIWVSVLVNLVYTDTGNRYSLNFAAYLTNNNSDIKDVSSVQLEDFDNEVSVIFGEWVHEEN